MSVFVNIRQQLIMFHEGCLSRKKIDQLHEYYQLSARNLLHKDYSVQYKGFYEQLISDIQMNRCKEQLESFALSLSNSKGSNSIKNSQVATRTLKILTTQIDDYKNAIQNIEEGIYKEHYDLIGYVECIRTVLMVYKPKLYEYYDHAKNPDNRNYRKLYKKTYEVTVNIMDRSDCESKISSITTRRNTASGIGAGYEQFSREMREGRLKRLYEDIAMDSSEMMGGVDRTFASINGERRLVRRDSKGRTFVKYRGQNIYLKDAAHSTRSSSRKPQKSK